MESEITNEMKENAFTYVPRIIAKRFRETACFTRAETPRSILAIEEPQTHVYAFPSEREVIFTEDFMKTFRAINIGNAMMRYLSSNHTKLAIINFSSPLETFWSFKHNEQRLRNVEFEYEKHLERVLQSLPTGCTKTIVLESSLTPLMYYVAESDRVDFLRRNIREIAKAFLRLAVRVQDQNKHIAICTYVHASSSGYYTEELKVVQVYNEMLREAAYRLKLGLIDLERYVVNIQPGQEGDIYFRYNRDYVKPLISKQGTPTEEGTKLIRRLIVQHEMERHAVEIHAESKGVLPPLKRQRGAVYSY